ncbi:Ubiquitin carboxyl-terminal hydrolase CYLD [Stylophora pistillata]|uniref:ubiquitinyl hydrolase 1 n=1 Tax=Stylophora pistillata TaxID=50429 RepID=A0A2B4RY37_STYPI|nr:Ubiquitin carboxyl-terminal hydrolase CYLD [Stylophora pistillata]
MVDMTRLHEEEANLLLAISSLELRYNTFQDRKRLLFGRQLSPGSKVNVKMKVASKELRGVVWYKGELPPYLGTWFGVQLLTPGQGTSDGTFRNRKYFECMKDSGVFVQLDKLTPLEDSPENQNVKRKDGAPQASFTSFIKDSLPSFRKGKYEQKSSMEMTEHGLEIDQRVVVFIQDKPARGSVRYIGDENGKKIVGLEMKKASNYIGNFEKVLVLKVKIVKEPKGRALRIFKKFGYSLQSQVVNSRCHDLMDKRIGNGTGKRNHAQKFIARRDYAIFVPLEAVMPEKDFDEEAEQPPKKETEKQDLSAEQNDRNELYAKSLGYLNVPSGRALRIFKKFGYSLQSQVVNSRCPDLMDERIGKGTGKRNHAQKFIARRDYAIFVPLEDVMPEKDFDEEAEQPPKKETEKQDLSAEQNDRNELYAKSLGYLNVPSERESSKKVRRANSFDAAETEVILAAGESSKTDPKEFIEKQRQLLKEAQSSNLVETDKDNDVHMHVEYRTSNDSNLNFQENHFKNTPPNSTFRPITKQPGLYQVDLTEEREKKLHSDYSLIEKNNELSKSESRQDASSVFSEGCSVEAMQLEKGAVGHTNQFSEKEVADSVAVATEEMEVDKLPEDSEEMKEAQITELHSAADSQSVESSQLMRNIPHGLEVGSMAEVPMSNVGLPRYGVVRWIGYLPEMKGKLVAGLELEEEQSPCSDGTFYGRRYFTCPAGRGFFVLVENCRPDSRFSNTSSKDKSFEAEKDFGSMPSPLIEGITEPPKTLEELHCGTMRGLQGHHNSCYLDATLYSMFSFSSVFDTLLHREKRDGDLEEYEKVQTVLRDLIVNPLRVTGFVRADRLLDLRHLLDKLSSTAGLVNKEKGD